MARITWQNVDAPNLLAAAASRSGAAASYTAGLNSLGDLFKNEDARRRAKGDAQAAEALLGIQSVDGFDAAAAGGNIFGKLGIDPNRMSEDTVNMALGWRDRLEGDRATDLDNRQEVFDFGRDQVDAQRNDQAFARSEELRDIDETALKLADEVARGSLSPQEAEIMIRDKTAGLDPRVYQAALQKLSAGGQGYWQTSGKALDPQTTQVLDTLGAELDKREQDLAFEFGSNPAAQLWNEGTSRYEGYASPLMGMIDRLGAQVGDENEEAFSDSKGKVTTTFNGLKSDFPEIPEGMIATILENNLRDDGYAFILGGDNVTFDEEKVRQQLETFNTPEGRNGLSQITTEYKRAKENITSTRTGIQTLVSELSLLRDRPQSETNDREIARRRAELEALYASLQTQEEAQPTIQGAPGQPGQVTTATVDPAAALLAEQRAQSGAPVAVPVAGPAPDLNFSAPQAPAPFVPAQYGGPGSGAPNANAQALPAVSDVQPTVVQRPPELSGAYIQEPSVNTTVSEIARAGGVPAAEAAVVSRAIGTLESRGATERERTTAMRQIRKFVREMQAKSEDLPDSMIEKLLELERVAAPQ